ncbi:ABC transporter substrate-binding protein [Microbacteriaceae bacterium K1510]|nr:ABC transporter substrate-binding protein [Microbacteriaceae bacterium K1510]
MPSEVRVIAFPGAPNLPVFAALERGYFAEEGVDVALTTTPSSVFQMEKFNEGAFDIAFTAFDNIVAYHEGMGAVPLSNASDFRVIMGATQVELSAVVAPDIKQAADLRGKTLALDAVGTGFAFVLYAMLEQLGLDAKDYKPVAVGATPERWKSVQDGTHAGTITIEPFTSIAAKAGFNVLRKSTDAFPAYQGGIVATRQSWAAKNAAAVRAFIRGYLKGLAWTLTPANRDAAAALLQAKMPEIKPGVVDAVLTSVLSPRSGLTPQAAILPEGMQRVLDLRSQWGGSGRRLSGVDKYIDLSFYNEALAGQ